MKKKVCYIVIGGMILPIFMLIIFDYLNIPSLLGLKIDNINYTLLGAIINAVVVITLFIITFVCIDIRQIEKYENTRKTASIIILSTYERCKEILDMVNNQALLEKYVIPKVDFNKTQLDNTVIMNLINDPFKEHLKILDFAAEGAVESNSLTNYYKVMKLYKSYISIRITCFDISKYEGEKYRYIKNKIDTEKNEISSLLKSEIERLNTVVNK